MPSREFSLPPPHAPLGRPEADALTLVRPMTAADWPDVERIYAAGIASRVATFETATPAREAFVARNDPHLSLVAVTAGRVVGWVAAGPVAQRCELAGVVEHSVYVDPSAHRRGLGRRLLGGFVERAESSGIWTIQASVLAGNVGSLGLHVACGFRVIGIQERLGAVDGRWCDVVLVERRSARVWASMGSGPGPRHGQRLSAKRHCRDGEGEGHWTSPTQDARCDLRT